MKKAQTDFENQKLVWQQNIDTLFVELQNGIKEHEKDFGSMTVKERSLSEQLLERKRQEYFQYKQAMEQKASDEDKRITAKIYEEVNAFVQQYGKEKGYKIILGANGSGNIMYAKEGMDITEQLMKTLNGKYAL